MEVLGKNKVTIHIPCTTVDFHTQLVLKTYEMLYKLFLKKYDKYVYVLCTLPSSGTNSVTTIVNPSVTPSVHILHTGV